MPTLIFVFVGTFLVGIMSGMSGGGGGILLTPLYIFLGLTPQQAVATGKLNGIGAAFGGLSAFRKSKFIRWEILKVMLPVAVVSGIAAPFVLTSIDSTIMQKILGIVMLLLAPTLLVKKSTNIKISKRVAALRKGAGYAAYSVILFFQAIFGTGIGSLVIFALTLLLGTSKLEANATRRAVTAVMAPIALIGMVGAGLVHFEYGVIGMVGAFIGTEIGTSIAIKKGEDWVGWVMAIPVVLSAVALLVAV